MLTTGCVSNSGEIHHARSASPDVRRPGGSRSSRRTPASWSRMDVGSGLSMPTSCARGFEDQCTEERGTRARSRRDAVGVPGAVQPPPDLVDRRRGWWCAPPSDARPDRPGRVQRSGIAAQSMPHRGRSEPDRPPLPVTTKSGAPSISRSVTVAAINARSRARGRDGESVERGAQNIPDPASGRRRSRPVPARKRQMPSASGAAPATIGTVIVGCEPRPRDDLRRRDERSIDFVYPVCRRGRQRQRRRHAKIGH